MKVIWAPWRMAYIKNARKPAGCIFCSKARQRQDAANLVLFRGTHGLVMMNLFPYNPGHLMVAPYTHVRSLEHLSAERALDLIRLTNLSLRVLRSELKPEGFNVGANLGRVSGAGIEAHVHLHIVPRWNGDTNFMPLFSQTKVIPEHLRATYRKLRARFQSICKRDLSTGIRNGARTRSAIVPAGGPRIRRRAGHPALQGSESRGSHVRSRKTGAGL